MLAETTSEPARQEASSDETKTGCWEVARILRLLSFFSSSEDRNYNPGPEVKGESIVQTRAICIYRIHMNIIRNGGKNYCIYCAVSSQRLTLALQKRECIFLLLFTQFIRSSNFWHHKWWWPQYGNLCFRLIYLYFIVLPKLSNSMLHWINEVKLQISFYPETQNPWKFMWLKEFLKYRRRKAILIQSQTCFQFGKKEPYISELPFSQVFICLHPPLSQRKLLSSMGIPCYSYALAGKNL